MEAPEDSPERSAVVLSLATQMEYLQGRIDENVAAERLGPGWKSAGRNMAFLTNEPTQPTSGPVELSDKEAEIARKWKALQLAWSRRWGTPTDSIG
jgi:hypothetical protein